MEYIFDRDLTVFGFLCVNSKLTCIIALLVFLPVLYLDLKRHCDALVYVIWLVIEIQCPDMGDSLQKGRLLTCMGSFFSDTSSFYFLSKFNQAAIIWLGSKRKWKDIFLSFLRY